jgi:hypothetical protein
MIGCNANCSLAADCKAVSHICNCGSPCVLLFVGMNVSGVYICTRPGCLVGLSCVPTLKPVVAGEQSRTMLFVKNNYKSRILTKKCG